MKANRLPRSEQWARLKAPAPLALLAILPVLAFAAPANAASGARVEIGRLEAVRFSGDIDGGRYGKRYEDRQFSTDALARLQERIDWAQSRGALSPREASSLQDRADDLRGRARAYWRSGGVDWQERRELDGRFQDLREKVRHLVWDREYRGRYRQEWRERSLWGENGWRGDDDRRPSGINRSELKGSEFDREDDGRDAESGRPGAYVPDAAPKPYDAPKSLTPKPRANGTQAPTPKPDDRGDDQPFKDGRDFH